LERVAGKDSNEQANEVVVPVGAAVQFPSEFGFGNGDTHKWQGRSDEHIKLAVMTALHWDLAIPRDRIEVKVSGGWVILTGRVARDYEKARAEADARMTAGVAGVINRLTCEDAN
jgi:osmotically-inducible protein OsmY